MRGIILAGGKGTRLLPATRVVNKHMVPILNRPMITFPLETLKAIGVKEVMVVSGGEHLGGIAEFLGDGTDFGVRITYRVQREAGGIAQALGLAEDFAKGERIAVILGDNVFDNDGLHDDVDPWEAHIFVKRVPDPTRFGVMRPVIEDMVSVFTIVEKPRFAMDGDMAVTGLYIYPPDVFEVIPKLKPSARGELEITDVNNHYVRERRCVATTVAGFWSDAGTPNSLYEVTKHVWEREIH